jgi:hypothetical protein
MIHLIFKNSLDTNSYRTGLRQKGFKKCLQEGLRWVEFEFLIYYVSFLALMRNPQRPDPWFIFCNILVYREYVNILFSEVTIWTQTVNKKTINIMLTSFCFCSKIPGVIKIISTHFCFLRYFKTYSGDFNNL